MSLKNVDMDSALRRLAERRIEEAMEAGKFDRIEGMGHPLELEELPADENARLTWWALRILRTHDVIPDEVKWRKSLESLKARLSRAMHEHDVIDLVGQINSLVTRLNTLGTSALPSGVAKLDLQEQLSRFQQASVSSPSHPPAS